MDNKSNRLRNILLKAIGIFVLVVIVVYGVIAVNLYSSVGRFPVGLPRPAPHITSLIWPTIGYPELIQPTEELEVEVMLPGGHRMTPAFTAALTPAEPGLSGIRYELNSTSVAYGASQRWPTGTKHGGDKVWRAHFQLPAGIYPILYDITVTASSGDGHTKETQHNAVSVRRPGSPGDYTFISLSDIHVHKPGSSSSYEKLSDKGVEPDGRPVFFEKAIDEVNLIRPDFAVILGDDIRAQHAPGDYQYEFPRFYDELDRFSVPVFIIPGNHDGYYNEVDGLKVWEENIGPVRYSFDVGDTHFTAVNTNDWNDTDRMVMSKFGTFVYPRKWQGQVRDAADERKPATYLRQLKWLRDDLASHQNASTRMMLLHHDPYREEGEADSWKNERFFGVFTMGGGGKGSTALKELGARYDVSYMLTGHFHSDYVGSLEWLNKKGKTVFANQTMVTFGSGGMDDSYPGYRIWDVKADAVQSFTYMDDYHSVPIYDGSSLTGATDLDHLDRLALQLIRPLDGGGFTVENYLGQELEVRGISGFVPDAYLSSISGAQAYETIPAPGQPGVSFVYMQAHLPAGIPGASATEPGSPSRTTVEVGPAGR